jgi:sugar-specific transcriptional regulator TrmB
LVRIRGNRALSRRGLTPLDERVWESLKRLGLSEYEVKAYMVLVNLKSGTASEISNASGIPVSKIYETLRSLEHKGLIRVERGRPMRYLPEHPQSAAEALKAALEGLLNEDLKLFVSTFAPIYEGEGPERPDIWIIRSEASLWRSVKEVIGRANMQLSIAIPVIPPEINQMLLSVASILKEKRGLVRIIISPQLSNKTTAKLLSNVAEVRVREITFGGGVINDSSEVVLLLLSPGENSPKMAIYSTYTALSGIAQLYFDMLWEHSERLKL